MFYKMLFDRFVGFAYLYTVLDMPRQIRIVCLHKDAVLCLVNNGFADKTSTEPGLVIGRVARFLAAKYGRLLSIREFVNHRVCDTDHRYSSGTSYRQIRNVFASLTILCTD